jgi:hypothetical protein
MAAGAILVGKYVIFVHDVKKTLGSALARQGLSVGYLDSRQMGIFIHHFSRIVRPIYGLWVLIALLAAVVKADPRKDCDTSGAHARAPLDLTASPPSEASSGVNPHAGPAEL